MPSFPFPFLLSLSSVSSLTAFPSIYIFLIFPFFSVFSPSLTFPLVYSPHNLSFLHCPSKHTIFLFPSLCIEPLLWHISCLCSWQALQEKTTGSSETMFSWQVTVDLWSVRFWPRGGHTTELWEHLIWALCWLCQYWENRLQLVWCHSGWLGKALFHKASAFWLLWLWCFWSSSGNSEAGFIVFLNNSPKLWGT